MHKPSQLGMLLLCSIAAGCGAPDGGETDATPALTTQIETVPKAEVETNVETPPAGHDVNAKILITLSCRAGSLPKRGDHIRRLNATFMRWTGDVRFKIYGLEEDDPEAFQGNFGPDGMAEFWLPDGADTAEIRVLPLDNDLEHPKNILNIANDKGQVVIIQRGKTVTKNFVLEQAYCDEFRDIRGIGATATTDSTNFFVALEGMGPDYDAKDGIEIAGSWGPASRKRNYTRTKSSGDIAPGPYGRPKLKGVRPYMRVRNIQTVRRIKRVCDDAAFNMDMTIRSDMELGIKTFDGSGPTGAVSCSKAYVTRMPVSLVEDYDDDNFYHTEIEGDAIKLMPRNNSAWGMREVRSTCLDEAKILEAPFDWEQSCFEADQTSAKIFEYVPGDPVGTTHSYSIRHDLGGPEEIKGKVNPGVGF